MIFMTNNTILRKIFVIDWNRSADFGV